ncbi:CvpA family protein [Phytohalomonas tamaricis]|uniref:CvpA family protein n=1 Tax=Phytohalomonas tamaricis TaxID=2081032 RepID=UPI000D0AED85|nr:CvpA family protein [Phytohalomonas tamaricis]
MSWTWVDWAFAAILLFSILSGAARGFIREGLGLIAWIGALLAARAFAGRAGEIFRGYVENSDIRLAIGFFLVVFVVIVVSGMVIRLLHSIIEWVGMGRFNRLLGALFGALKGGAILVLIAAIVGLTPWRTAPDWQESQLRPMVAQARDWSMQQLENWDAERTQESMSTLKQEATSRLPIIDSKQ